jgi:hypothetical protein
MRKKSCGKRAAMIATKLSEPYMVPHRNQGNEGARNQNGVRTITSRVTPQL